MYRHGRIAKFYFAGVDEERGSSVKCRDQTAKRPHVHGFRVTFLALYSYFTVLRSEMSRKFLEFSYGASQSRVPILDLSLLGFFFRSHAAPPKSVRIIRASTAGFDISTFSGFRSLCTMLVIDTNISVLCLT